MGKDVASTPAIERFAVREIVQGRNAGSFAIYDTRNNQELVTSPTRDLALSVATVLNTDDRPPS